MSLLDSDKTQEIFLIVGDSWRGANRKWLLFLAVCFICALPLYFAVSLYVYNISMTTYSAPTVTQATERAPLEEVSKGFIKISGNTYSAFVKLRNSNLEWGTPKLEYRSEIHSLDGSLVASNSGSSFVLPSSEKLIVLPRFTSDKAPTQLDFSILNSAFVLKAANFPDINLDVQRSQITHQGNETILSAVVKNTSAFTIKQIDVTAVIYNERSEIVAINYTNFNDITSGELRSFQMSWPVNIPGTLRAEVTPEINVFDKDILKTQGPVSPF